MNIVQHGEAIPYLPDNTIRGIEINGVAEALTAARNLGAYALKATEGAIIPEVSHPLGFEALTLQAQLLGEIERGSFDHGPVVFMAQDGQAGRVLKGAIELDSEVVEATAKRNFLRFPPYPLVNFTHGDDKQDCSQSKSSLSDFQKNDKNKPDLRPCEIINR